MMATLKTVNAFESSAGSRTHLLRELAVGTLTGAIITLTGTTAAYASSAGSGVFTQSSTQASADGRTAPVVQETSRGGDPGVVVAAGVVAAPSAGGVAETVEESYLEDHLAAAGVPIGTQYLALAAVVVLGAVIGVIRLRTRRAKSSS
jgi:hypothetical protein